MHQPPRRRRSEGLAGAAHLAVAAASGCSGKPLRCWGCRRGGAKEGRRAGAPSRVILVPLP